MHQYRAVRNSPSSPTSRSVLQDFAAAAGAVRSGASGALPSLPSSAPRRRRRPRLEPRLCLAAAWKRSAEIRTSGDATRHLPTTIFRRESLLSISRRRRRRSRRHGERISSVGGRPADRLQNKTSLTVATGVRNSSKFQSAIGSQIAISIALGSSLMFRK